jgi:penicillin-binding protein 1A
LDYSPLALGGMTDGVTVREMAGAYTTFINDGMTCGTRSYTKVLDSDGTLVLDNTPEPTTVFEQEKTVYYMRDLLTGVVESSNGTARSAKVDGMATAGKTGTTERGADLWFCGFTPYYVGATWFGYDKDYNLSNVSGNPSTKLWTTVMQRIHEDLPNASFPTADNRVSASYCLDSGMKPTSACSSDVSGSRVATGSFWPGDVPTEECNLHTFVTVCADSEMKPSEYCPSTKSIALLDLTRQFPISVSVADQWRCFTGSNPPVGSGSTVGGGDSKYFTTCTEHVSVIEGLGNALGELWNSITGSGVDPNGEIDPETGTGGSYGSYGGYNSGGGILDINPETFE